MCECALIAIMPAGSRSEYGPLFCIVNRNPASNVDRLPMLPPFYSHFSKKKTQPIKHEAGRKSYQARHDENKGRIEQRKGSLNDRAHVWLQVRFWVFFPRFLPFWGSAISDLWFSRLEARAPSRLKIPCLPVFVAVCLWASARLRKPSGASRIRETGSLGPAENRRCGPHKQTHVFSCAG